ncbi:tRNA (adenosine(37)-N6)-threonylcarbamoyltransferase complex ATPase subunit type 1 TsaE [bacterium]|nr:tRNA (adenosine(37)-N6)-threonylcarbamoyltransferase complex ATPase subunit type 1 TsaE [bacterium]
MLKFKSESLEDTFRIAKQFLSSISKTKQKNRALLVLLSGELGSGKTAFVKQVAKIVGIKERVVSPTFVLMRKYAIPPSTQKFPFSNLIHIDAYRLEKRKELTALNWKEISCDPRNIIFLEWPEKVFTRSLRDAKKIMFKFVDEKTRGIDFL